MKTYRVWKESKQICYQDVEADSEEEAQKYVSSPQEYWTTADAGLIGDNFVTDDLDRLDGAMLFAEHRIAESQAMIKMLQET